MAFTIPDKGEAVSDFQTVFFQEYLDALIAGQSGIDCVLSGGNVTANGSDFQLTIAKSAVLSNRTLFATATSQPTISTAHATLPRIDLVVIDNTGAATIRTGTAALLPKPPARSANDVLLRAIYVPAAATALTSNHLLNDLRVTPNFPVTIYRTTAQELTNTSNAAIDILNKAGGGVSIPDGLFLTGRKLTGRIGGKHLCNSGSNAITFTFIYGGTTLFAKTAGTYVADADYGALYVEFVLTAVTDATQAVAGRTSFSPLAARATPTTGVGDTGLSMIAGGFEGTSSVNSDNANRVLQVQVTNSVSNSAVEVVIDTAELILS